MEVTRWQVLFWVVWLLFAPGGTAGQSFLSGSPPATSSLNCSSAFALLQWEPSPSSHAVGYFVDYRRAGDQTTHRTNVGNGIYAIIGGLTTNATYYFSVVAYAASGQESLPSNEVAYTVPTTPGEASLPKLRVHLISTSAGADLLLAFPGKPGALYSIEASEDLQRWVALWTTNCTLQGPLLFHNQDPATYSNRFYRARQR